jgi:hypothetical protein
MAVRLHNPGYDNAKKLVREGKVALDERDDWSEHQPSATGKTPSSKRTGTRSSGAGTSASTRRARRTPRVTTSSPTGTS